MKTAQSIERAKELLDGLIAALPTDALEKLQQECGQMAASFHAKRRKTYLKLGLFGAALLVRGFYRNELFAYQLGENIFGGMPLERGLIVLWLLWGGYIVTKKDFCDFEIAFDSGGGKQFSYVKTATSIDDPANLRFWNEARQGAHGMINSSIIALAPSQKMHLMFEKFNHVFYLLGPFVFGFFAWIFATASPLLFGLAVITSLYHGLVPQRVDPNAFCEADAYTTIIQVLDSRGAQRGARRL